MTQNIFLSLSPCLSLFLYRERDRKKVERERDLKRIQYIYTCVIYKNICIPILDPIYFIYCK